MTGAALLGLILISMGWLFFLAGLAVNYHALRRSFKRREGEAAPPNLRFLPGVAGSVAMFFSIPWISSYGFELPWPWLWILLPLVIDPFCLPGLFLLLRK